MTPRSSARTLATLLLALLMAAHGGSLPTLAAGSSTRERPPYVQTPTPDTAQPVGDGTSLVDDVTPESESVATEVALVVAPLSAPVATELPAGQGSQISASRPKPEPRAYDNPAAKAERANDAKSDSTKDDKNQETTIPRLDDPVLRWLPEIMAAAKANDVPAELIAGVMRLESNGNPNIISPDGARGLMQIMPDQLIGQGIPDYLWHDPATSIMAGGYELLERSWSFGSWEGAVGSYFGFGCDVFGTCTEVYVSIVFGWAAYYKPILASPLSFGFGVLPADWVAPPIVPFVEAAPLPPEPPPTTTPTPVATETPVGTSTATPVETPGATATEPVVTETPTEEPTTAPTEVPTEAPTEAPTDVPTEVPTDVPTESPTEVPTDLPTEESPEETVDDGAGDGGEGSAEG